MVAMCLSTLAAGTRRLVPQLLLAMLLVMTAGLAACGGGGGASAQINSNGTPAGTYSILVTASSGTVAHSTTVTLTVI
jgi:hypothetical protein